MRQFLSKLVVTALALAGAGCLKVAPYQRPVAAAPQGYKEAPPDGWKEAQPSDGVIRGKWGESFGDADLNALEEQVNLSNQNEVQAEARFREAQAAVRVSRSALFPTVSAAPSVTGSETSARLNA